MDISKYTSYKKPYILIIVLLAFATILSFMHIVIEEVFFHHQTEKTALSNAVYTAKDKEKEVQYFLADSKKSLKWLRESMLFKGYHDNASREQEVENLFFTFSKTNFSIKRLRYIDQNGYEKIRVDRADKDTDPIIAPRKKLERKSTAPYFIDSKKKPLEEVWFSDIGLDPETSKTVVFSAILPLEHNKKFGGVLIIDYFMEDFLNELLGNSLYDIILCDGSGYPLLHYNPQKNWGKYQRKPITISTDFPKRCQKILHKDSVQEKDFFSQKLHLPGNINEGLYMVFQLKNEFIENEKKHSHTEYFSISLSIFITSIILTFIIVRLFSKTLFNLNALQELNNELIGIRLRQKIALTASKIGIWECELETRTLNWDRQMYSIYGIDPLQSDDLCYTWRHTIDPNDRERVETAINHAMMTNTDFNCSFWIITPDGERKFIRALGMHEYDENGKALRLVGTNQNLTELKEKEMELKEREAFMIRQNRATALGEMLSMIAHQWRQPINAISTAAIGIGYRIELNELNNEMLLKEMNFIEDQCQKMSQTINDFMNFANPNPKKELFHLKDSIQTVFNMVRPQFDNRQIDLNLDSCENIQLFGMKNEMDHVLINLLGNARDAFDAHDVDSKHINIRSYIKEHVATIEITDNAGGISETIIENIFDPYFTTKEKTKGTGIGLYMTKTIIEKRFKGTIEVENTGDGARFTIHIPIV